MRPTANRDALPHADHIARVAAREAPTGSATDARLALVDLSWRRCLSEFRLDPSRDYEPTVLDHRRVVELQSEHDELVQIARAEMDALYEQIAGSGYALLLADADGVILCERVDPALKQQFGHAGLIVGAEWSERREGTNGIGTCAAEARPITIHETDHFRTRHTGLSCSAAPIRDSSGRLVAVLDASCVNARARRESQMHTVALVNASANLIEKCLFLRRHRGDALLRFHDRPEYVDLLHDGAIAVGVDGRIVAADSTGLRLLGAAGRTDLIGRPITEVFDTSIEELLATTIHGRRAIWELRDRRHGRRYFASIASAASAPRLHVPANAHAPGRGSRATASSAAAESAPRTPVAAPREPALAAREAGTAAMSLADLAGNDPRMQRNLRNARRIADSGVPVILYGPTGSGKEAFAKALHQESRRARQPFVAVNCAAIPETLIESELYGYTHGAFTGARKEGMRGRVLQSSGGTLFLDEIGDMPLLAQTRLLRVLEEGEVTPLGAESPIRVNLRVMCASNRNLRELMSRGQFREDLYYRLNGLCIELPPLAERADKRRLILDCVMRESPEGRQVTVDPEALDRLLAYSWPGNIRELRNAIRAAVAICDRDLICCDDLPDDVREAGPTRPGARHRAPHSARVQNPSREPMHAPAVPAPPADRAQPSSLAAAERAALVSVIAEHDFNMTRVAMQLGISRNTLYRKIKRHAIPLDRPEPAD
ncbi:MAG: sigma-54-dependent Fis family transcriptional regulator [Gammaproteobacteria bacterium]|nr:sigma-54-dependent Fis family transcriptional regulator [Gammaproteobacteria bacterium]